MLLSSGDLYKAKIQSVWCHQFAKDMKILQSCSKNKYRILASCYLVCIVRKTICNFKTDPIKLFNLTCNYSVRRAPFCMRLIWLRLNCQSAYGHKHLQVIWGAMQLEGYTVQRRVVSQHSTQTVQRQMLVSDWSQELTLPKQGSQRSNWTLWNQGISKCDFFNCNIF